MARTKDNFGPFSVLRMKDVFDECSETLSAAIQKQTPDINIDAFDMALRQLVMSYGSGPAYSGMNGVIASIQEPAPMYIEAADVLVLARKAFVEGDLEEALKLFALSNDSDNADDLYDALALNNSKSELGVIHASVIEAEDNSEDEESEDEDENTEDGNYDVEDDDTPLYDLKNADDENGGDYDESSDDEDDSSEDEDDEDEDEEVESKVKLIARTLRLHAEEDEVDNTSDEKTDTADDETEENEPNGGTSSGKFNANSGKPQSIEAARRQRIAANKMSLDGTDNSIAKATIKFKRAG